MLDNAETLLLMPDLFNYLLTGEKKSEVSIASTTQMMDADKKVWSEKVLAALDIPQNLLTEIVPSGTVVGKLSDSICHDLNAPKADVSRSAVTIRSVLLRLFQQRKRTSSSFPAEPGRCSALSLTNRLSTKNPRSSTLQTRRATAEQQRS
jgi:hypothetical protein